VTRNRETLDPALSAEARMDRMREEMYLLRRTIVSLAPEPFRQVIDPPYNLTREESQQWLSVTVEKVIELTEPDSWGKAACPLCAAVPQIIGIGFSYPIGLERHLLGSHRSVQCSVIHAANGLRRVRHREQFPGDYGPYGPD
jgi:hypothetical protein